MKVEQRLWTATSGWSSPSGSTGTGHPQIVLYFTAPDIADFDKRLEEIHGWYPESEIIGCTTGGEIFGDEVLDDCIVVNAIRLEKSRVRTATTVISCGSDSNAAGRQLGEALSDPDLATIFVLSDGLLVNGSELVKGITAGVGRDVPLTGGMAGDGDRFGVTLVGANGAPEANRIVAVGMYGASLIVGHGSMGGWDVFGPERLITRSDGNILYELDGEPALDLYKRYLGDEAKNLPSSALLFPLKIRPDESSDQDVVRTIVGIDEENQTMTFAGNVPEGYVAQLMRGNFDHLVEGAAAAAQQAMTAANGSDSLAILVSCIGRKLLMGQRIGEEVEAVAEVLGPKAAQTGFYSYGEISPHAKSGMCELHNQTMTITVLAER